MGSLANLLGGSLFGASGDWYSNAAASNASQLNLSAGQRAQDQWYAIQQAQAMQNIRLETAKVLPPVNLPEEELICATGGLVGWRAWNVTAFGNTLKSFNGTEWNPYTRMVAVCKDCGSECSCGIYAWKRDVMSAKPPDFNALKSICGEVWLWGRVLECEHGYRAEFAYPKAFMNTGLLAKRIAEVYRVPLLKEAA